MFDNKYTIPIEKGDIVAISYNNYMVLGIYAGRGKTGSFQYYSIWGLSERERLDANSKMSKYEKGYVNAPHKTRIVKIHPDFLSDEYYNAYGRALSRLERNNIKL